MEPVRLGMTGLGWWGGVLTETANGAEELSSSAGASGDGGKPETGGPEGLESVAVLEATVASAERGEPVEPAALP